MAAHYKIKYKRKRRISIFSIVMLVVTVIIPTVIAITLNYLWNYLEAYESHNPAQVVNHYMDSLAEKNYTEVIKASGFSYDYFNDQRAFDEYITKQFDDNFLNSKALKTGSDGENLKYSIYAGDKKIWTLTLIPDNQKDKYGMQGWTLKTDEINKTNSIKICVPYGSKVFIDEREVPDEYLTADEHGINVYSALDNKEMAPKFSSYEVKELLNKPVVTAVSDTGEAYEISTNSEDNTATAFPKITEEWSTQIDKTIETTAIKYATFTTQDSTFEELSGYLLKESEFYRSIKDFENEWQPEHTFTYDNVAIKDLVKYDEEHFTANISFKYTLNRGARNNSYDVSYNTCFIKADGIWKLVTIY